MTIFLPTAQLDLWVLLSSNMHTAKFIGAINKHNGEETGLVASVSFVLDRNSNLSLTCHCLDTLQKHSGYLCFHYDFNSIAQAVS